MVTYATHWNILDKEKKVIDAQKRRPCFADLARKFPDNAQYLEYDFTNYDKSLTIHDMYRYFLFLKNIPEFAVGMPYDVYYMAENQKLVVDLEKINGLQLFSLLTVVRAVREDPLIVKEVLKFDHSKEYSWTKLGILKACGSLYKHNSGHWLTGNVSLPNVNKGIRNKTTWESPSTAKETGLIRMVNSTFGLSDDGYAVKIPIKQEHIDAVLAEGTPVEKPKPKRKPAVKKTAKLIVDF